VYDHGPPGENGFHAHCLLGENLTNSDDLVIRSENLAARPTGVCHHPVNAYRKFGRRWESGTVINF
jgi:hypothetical protein